MHSFRIPQSLSLPSGLLEFQLGPHPSQTWCKREANTVAGGLVGVANFILRRHQPAARTRANSSLLEQQPHACVCDLPRQTSSLSAGACLQMSCGRAHKAVSTNRANCCSLKCQHPASAQTNGDQKASDVTARAHGQCD